MTNRRAFIKISIAAFVTVCTSPRKFVASLSEKEEYGFAFPVSFPVETKQELALEKSCKRIYLPLIKK